MFFPFVLLAVSLFYYSYHRERSVEGLTFPDDLQTWCPYTSFCDQNASKPLPRSERNIPCCKPCSCDPDCGLTRSCCHDELDQHKLVETLQMTCKPLNTKRFDDRTDDYFYMVDTCPYPDQQEACKTVNVSIFGSFIPVFSHQTGMIYYNSVCAECHNQTDTTSFIPTLACPDIYKHGLSVVFDAINGLDEECYFSFLTPKEIDTASQKCYPVIIRSCRFTTDGDLVHKCSSFNATFVSKSFPYQNVYCYQCNLVDIRGVDNFLESYSLCPKPGTGRLFGESGLTILLNKNTVDLYERSVTEGPVNDDTICFINIKSLRKVCRPKLCPEGQFRVEGRCQLLGYTWYIQRVKVWINLTLTDESDNLTLHDLQQVTEQDLASPNKDFLSRPALHDWVLKLFYGLKNNDSSVRCLLAFLFLRNQILKPTEVLQGVKNSMKGTWKLNISGKTFEFQASFSNYATYYPLEGMNGAYHHRMMYGGDDEHRVYRWPGQQHDIFFDRDGLGISKLFFCNQVALEEDDFVYSDVEIENVYIKHSWKHLGNGEFIVRHGGFKDGIRICIYDLFENDAKRTMCDLLGCLLMHYISKFVL